ncbi:hypothetical protein E2C01_073949 [Portunus trituberculatus]|uniref:Uncharacterized protein n=1 Tax=Portunus trituberculatus TaxID=210409 RepID=A0A5B7I236_PORTR|nr:hypothetical protein [Portunus trituberculatus]
MDGDGEGRESGREGREVREERERILSCVPHHLFLIIPFTFPSPSLPTSIHTSPLATPSPHLPLPIAVSTPSPTSILTATTPPLPILPIPSRLIPATSGRPTQHRHAPAHIRKPAGVLRVGQGGPGRKEPRASR